MLLLIDASVRMVVLAGLTGLFLRLARVRSAGVRHAAWTGVLIAMLSMPVLPALLPAVEWPFRVPGAVAIIDSFGDSYAAFTRPAQMTDVRPASGPIQIGSEPAATATSIVRTEYAPPPQGSSSLNLVVMLYLAVAAFLLGRFAIGWWTSARVARRAARTAISVDVPVYESRQVSTPVTIGVLFPRIVLPVTWVEWSEEKRSAVVAHEQAHIARRDPLVAALANLNRALFWFHPVAWWLKRTLSVHAEHACDIAAVAVVGRDRYASILLETAEAARWSRGRLIHSLGVDGTGQIGRRVTRVLEGDLSTGMSRARKVVVAVGCVGLIGLVASCRRSESVAPLREDPELAATIAERAAEGERWKAAAALSAEEVNRLEATLKTNPDDPQTRETLLLFYRQSGDKVFGWNEMIERRLPHLLWSIEHQPEGEVGYTKVSASADPVGYSAGKKAWLAEVDKAGASAETFRRAASFVREREPRLAEQVLLRGKERHPDDRPRTVNGVYYASLSVALGELYGQIINGQFRRQAVSEFEVDAQHATERLEQSSDPALLVGAGRQLIRTAGRVRENARLTSLGRQLIERAFKLNEDFEGADSARQYLRSREEAKPDSDLIERVWKQQVALAEPSVASRVRPGDVFWLSKLDKREKLQFWELGLGAVDSLPLEDQLRWLVLDTQRKYMQAENWYKSFDTDYMKSLDDLSMKSAMKTLEVARTAANSRQRGDGIYYANVVLALVTFHGGDRRGAVRYMRDASEAPALSDREARSGMTGVDQRLAHYLLKEGERESVAEFYEAVARLKPPSRERLLKAAAAVRDGRMPENYQRVMWNQ